MQEGKQTRGGRLLEGQQEQVRSIMPHNTSLCFSIRDLTKLHALSDIFTKRKEKYEAEKFVLWLYSMMGRPVLYILE